MNLCSKVKKQVDNAVRTEMTTLFHATMIQIYLIGPKHRNLVVRIETTSLFLIDTFQQGKKKIVQCS
jgi:hypothetical protein